MTIKSLFAVGCVAILLVGVGSTPAARPKPPTPNFFPIDFPGAIATSPREINEPGDIVGFYFDPQRPAGPVRGFLLSQGLFSSIDFPGAFRTIAYGINPAGQIVGSYRDQLQRDHGFLLSGGQFATIDFPGAQRTDAFTIDASGDIVGSHRSDDGLNDGFLLSQGSFTSIEVPGARFTIATGLGPAGRVAGGYQESGLEHSFFGGHGRHAFLLNRGRFTTFDVPFPDGDHTSVTELAPSGEILGNYRTPAGQSGFLLRRGQFTSFDYPGAAVTIASGINSRGQIVGTYRLTPNAPMGGFLLEGLTK